MPPFVSTCDEKGCICKPSLLPACREGDQSRVVEPIDQQPGTYADIPKLADLLKPGFQICCMMADQERPTFGQFKLNPPAPAASSNSGGSPPPPPPPPEGDRKDYNPLIIGGVFAVAALVSASVAALLIRNNNRKAAALIAAAEDIGRATILPLDPNTGAPSVVPEPVPPAAPPVNEPQPTPPDWDPRLLREAFEEWQRNFDAMPDQEKPDSIKPWNHEELANQYLAKGDIIPAPGFVLGEPAPHTNELITANFGDDQRAYALLKKAREIGEKIRASGRPQLDAAIEIAGLITSTYANDKGGDVDPIRVGVFDASGANKEHRFILLQIALQEALIPSRFVQGRFVGGSFHRWVEIDAKGDGKYSYVVDLQRGLMGWKQNAKSARQHGYFGDAELFAMKGDRDKMYLSDAHTFNSVWHPKTPERMAAEFEPAFKLLCEQMSVIPSNADLAANPVGKGEIARRAAADLISWIAKTQAERQGIIDGLTAADRAVFEQQRRVAASFSKKAGAPSLEEFVIPEPWIRQQEAARMAGVKAAALAMFEQPKSGMDLDRTMELLHILHQLKTYTAVTRLLDTDQQIEMARALADSAHAAGVTNGEIPPQIVDAVSVMNRVPGKSVGPVVMGSASSELDALIARRVQSVKAQLLNVKQWRKESGGSVTECDDWYKKLNPERQELVARVVVVGGLRPKYSGSVKLGQMAREDIWTLLRNNGIRTLPDTDGLQIYNYDLPHESAGIDTEVNDFGAIDGDVSELAKRQVFDSTDHILNEVRLQFDRRVEYVVRQFSAIPELADADKRTDVARNIVLDALMSPPKDGIVQKGSVAQAMNKNGIKPRVVENVRLYPTDAEERMNLYTEHELLVAQMNNMPEYEGLTPEELSAEAERLIVKSHALSASNKYVISRDPAMKMETGDFMPRAWVRAERLTRVAREMGRKFNIDFSSASLFVRANSEGMERLQGLWGGLTQQQRKAFDGGYAEFQLRMVMQQSYTAEVARTQGAFDAWRRERLEVARRQGWNFEEMIFKP